MWKDLGLSNVTDFLTSRKKNGNRDFQNAGYLSEIGNTDSHFNEGIQNRDATVLLHAFIYVSILKELHEGLNRSVDSRDGASAP